MKTSLSSLLALPLALGLVLGACGNDSRGPIVPHDDPGTAAGSFSIRYDGPMQAGDFDVQGAARLNGDGTWAVGDWATGARVRSEDQELLAGYATRQQGSRHDYVSLMVIGSQAGDYGVGEFCERDCATLGIAFGLQQGNPTGFEYSCVLDTGRIRITSLDSDRMRGTITGSGTCASVAGGAAPFTLTGGAFDLPVPAAF